MPFNRLRKFYLISISKIIFSHPQYLLNVKILKIFLVCNEKSTFFNSMEVSFIP